MDFRYNLDETNATLTYRATGSHSMRLFLLDITALCASHPSYHVNAMRLVLEEQHFVLPSMQLQSSLHAYSKIPKDSWKGLHLPFWTLHAASLMSPNYPRPLVVHWASKSPGRSGQPLAALCYTWKIRWTTIHKSYQVCTPILHRMAHILCQTWISTQNSCLPETSRRLDRGCHGVLVSS